MNTSLLNADVQDFINQNLDSDPTALILKGIPFKDVTAVEVVEQIEAKKKCKAKLNTWFKQPHIYYPNKLNIEQTSSELTATYKSSLIQGKSLIDLTGGFGVDAYYFSKVVEQVSYFEINFKLAEIVRHNFEVLQVQNIEVYNKDGFEHLRNSAENYDWIYIDPSRRHESKGKVFFLKDSIPNIPEHLDILWSRSKNIMIKTSPLLDISIGINELEHVKSIQVIAVKNEVKELLWILEYGFVGSIKIHTTNLTPKNEEHFDFYLEDELKIEASLSAPLTYLFEPNSAIMKSGGFNALTTAFKVRKLHKHSHLYTSDDLIDFPGRIFKIEQSVPYHKKQIKKLSIKKANITTRNFPETVEKIRNTFKFNDGGAKYLFFTTNLNNEKIMLVCTKAN